MRREGSPWRGLNVVFFRELFDHLTSARMLVLELLVLLFGTSRQRPDDALTSRFDVGVGGLPVVPPLTR